MRTFCEALAAEYNVGRTTMAAGSKEKIKLKKLKVFYLRSAPVTNGVNNRRSENEKIIVGHKTALMSTVAGVILEHI